MLVNIKTYTVHIFCRLIIQETCPGMLKRNTRKFSRFIGWEEQEKTKVTKRKRTYVLNNVSLTAEDLKYACIVMVCVEGRPLSHVSGPGLKIILDPIIDALPSDDKITITPETVRRSVIDEADNIREAIKQEIKVSQHVDFRNKLQSTLSINALCIIAFPLNSLCKHSCREPTAFPTRSAPKFVRRLL